MTGDQVLSQCHPSRKIENCFLLCVVALLCSAVTGSQKSFHFLSEPATCCKYKRSVDGWSNIVITMLKLHLINKIM